MFEYSGQTQTFQDPTFFFGGGGGGCMAPAAPLPPWLCPRLSLTKHILKQNCTEHFILCKEERKTKIMKRFE